MSRQIDLNASLSKRDKLYLQERNRGHLIKRVKSAQKEAVEPEVEIVEETPPETSEAVETEADTEGEYAGMKAEELKALLTARDLSTAGNKDELLARLDESGKGTES